MIKLACSTLCFGDASIGPVLDEIRNGGFGAIDLALIPGSCNLFDAARQSAAEREDFVALLRRSGLRVPTVTSTSSHFSVEPSQFEAVIRSTTAYLKLAALLGADGLNVNCGSSFETRAFVEREIQMLAAGLKRVAREAARLGLRINVEAPHCHGLCRSVSEAEYLLDDINEPNVFLLFDVPHVTANREDPSSIIKRLGTRIGHVRLRDANAENPSLELGGGDVSFRRVFERLLEVGYGGYCALELRFPVAGLDGSRAALERAVRFLERTLSEIGCRFESIDPSSPAVASSLLPGL